MYKAQNKQSESYIFPDQAQPHQATWLQWPHSHQYGDKYQKSLEAIWVAMTKALSEGEIVRIIVYNQGHLDHVNQLLQGVNNVEFFIWKTDDVWIRDNGPIFARDANTGELVIQHWGFNAWGEKAKFSNCAKIPSLIAQNLNFQLVNLTQQMINEGGSVQIDGHGTMLVCESSTLNNNRNYGLNKQDAEYLFKQYYGVSNIIWLKGVPNQDITDCHVDGFAKFLDNSYLMCLGKQDLEYWGLNKQDIQKLHSCKNAKGQPYQIIEIPLTENEYRQQDSKQKVKGSYINFYIGNRVILVPQYGDSNDKVALSMIQDLYNSSGRRAIGINVVNLFAKGGMIHCVTQQQPRR